MGNPHPDHRLSDGIEPMQLKTFQEIYDVLDSTTIAALAFDHLPFAFRQHDLRAKWEEGQDGKLLDSYNNFFQTVTDSYLGIARLFNTRDWKWICDRLENDATGVLDDGVENFIETLSSNMKKWENQTHVREAATNITRILLMYRSEHHIKPKKQSVNNTVHEEFRKLIKNAFKSGLVDPDDLVSNILQQIENDVQNSELEPFAIISNHNRILYGWASLTYLKEHKMHAFNPAATTRMKALNHSYPILNLPSGEMLELHMDSARVQPSSDGPKFALSHEFWKTMSDNNYLNKNWFSGNNIFDFTPPSQRPVYLLKKEEAGSIPKDYLPFLEWETYHQTMRTFEKNERTLLDANKQCELSGIRAVLDIQTYHESIVPLMKAIMKGLTK